MLASTGRGYNSIVECLNSGDSVQILLPKGKQLLKKTLKYLNKLAKEFEVDYRFGFNENFDLVLCAKKAAVGATVGGVISGVAAYFSLVAPIAIPIAIAAGAAAGAATEVFDAEIKIIHRRSGQEVVVIKI